MSEKLKELAHACNSGACNVRGLLRSLGECIGELQGQPSDSVELKIIIGQVSYLIGESLGPSTDALEKYEQARGLALIAAAGAARPNIDEIAETIRALNLKVKPAKCYKTNPHLPERKEVA